MNRILVLSSIFLAVLIITGCQSAEEPTSVANEIHTEVSSPTESAPGEPQATVTEQIVEPTQELSPTEIPTETTAITPEPADDCLECHQDKQRLIDTAKPEEDTVSESSGEG